MNAGFHKGFISIDIYDSFRLYTIEVASSTYKTLQEIDTPTTAKESVDFTQCVHKVTH